MHIHVATPSNVNNLTGPGDIDPCLHVHEHTGTHKHAGTHTWTNTHTPVKNKYNPTDVSIDQFTMALIVRGFAVLISWSFKNCFGLC